MSRNLLLLFTSLSIALFSSFGEAANSGITFQGRILKPDGSSLEGANVQFRFQVRTPNSNSCLMFEELQARDMRNSKGVFSLTMNDGTGVRTDTSGFGIDRVFSNSGNFTFAGTACLSGSTYTPNEDDSRSLIVYFKDETMATWEPMPPQNINFVPFAFESKQVQGFNAKSILRVQESDGTLGNFSPMSNAQYTELLALIAGTSTQFGKPNQLNGRTLPTLAAGQVLGWNGTDWVAAAAGTTSSPTTKLTSTTTPALGVTFQVDPAIASNYTITWPATAGSNGQVLTTNGFGVMGWVTPLTASTGFVQGGNAFGVPAVLGTTDAQPLSLVTGGAAKMTVLANGNVGVGTASPLNDLGTANGDYPAGWNGMHVKGGNVGMLALDGTESRLHFTSTSSTAGKRNFALDYRSDRLDFLSLGEYLNTDRTPMTILYDGNVGIGTTTPSANLSVRGDQRLESSGSTGPKLTIVNTAGGGATTPQLNIRKFGGSGSPILRMQNSGGTEAAPGPTTTSILGQLQFGGYGDTGGNDFGAVITARATATWTDASNPTRLDFSTTPVGSASSALRLRIDEGGRVAIGSGAPTANLHIKAGTAVAGYAPLKFTSSGAGVLLGTAEDGAMEYDGAGLWFTIGSTRYTIPMNTVAGNYSNVSTISNSGGSISMTPSAGNSVIVNQSTVSTSSSTGALVVNGGVGVAGAINSASNISSGGTVSAVNSMITPQIYGSSAASGNVKIDGTSDSTKGNVLLASAGGNVGVGTASPTSRLHVVGPNSAGYPLVIQAAPGTGAGGFMNVALNNTTSGAYKSSIEFQNNGTPKFSFGVDYTGAGLNDFSLFDNAAGAMRFFISPTGKVGIGTASPAEKLHIAGDDAAIVLENPSTVAYSSARIHLRATEVGATGAQFYFMNEKISAGAGTGNTDFQLRATNAAGDRTDLMRVDSATRSIRFNPSKTAGAVYGATTFENGNVGIGVTTPQARLDLGTGDLRFQDSANSAISYSLKAAPQSSDNRLILTSAGTTNGTRLWFDTPNGSSGFSMAAAGTEKMYVGADATSAGIRVYDNFLLRNGAGNTMLSADNTTANVGIGAAASATARLSVSGSSPSGVAVITNTVVDPYATTFVGLAPNITNGQAAQFKIGKALVANQAAEFNFTYNSAGSVFSLGMYGTPQILNYNTSGNVGVGTAAPTSKLHVAGVKPAIMAEDTGGGTAGGGVLSVRQNTGAVTSANERLGVINFNGSSNGGVLQVGSAIESYAVGGWGSAGYVDSYMKFNIGKGGTLSEVMRLSNNGNVGIGTTNPTSLLTVSGTTNLNNILSVGTGSASVTYNGRNIFDVTGNANMTDAYVARISDTTTSPAADRLIFTTESNNVRRFSIAQTGDTYVSGNLGVGVTTPAYKLQVGGIIAPSADGTYDLGATGFRFNTLYAVNGTVNTSDVRQKRLIENSDLGLEFVNTLRPVSYKWKVGDNEIHYGVIAQETEAALKSAKEKVGKTETTTAIVAHDEKTDTYGVRYTELLAPVIKAIQELFQGQKKIERNVASVVADLKTASAAKDKEIADLKSRADKVEKENAAIKAWICKSKDKPAFCK